MYFSLQGPKEEDYRLPYLSHQQLPAGILPMVPEVAQAVGVCQGPQAKDYGRALPNPGKTTMTALIANELLYAGSSLTAEAVLKSKGPMNQLPLGPLSRPSEQLGYLAAVQGLQVTQPLSLYFFQLFSASRRLVASKQEVMFCSPAG